MELKMKDVMEILKVPEKEILKYIREKGMPAHKINHQNMFNKEEVKAWVIRNGMTVSEELLQLAGTGRPVRISELILNGGFIQGVKGGNPVELLTDAVKQMKLPSEVRRPDVLTSLIEREEMMPTAVGRGIAIPHPRNPIIADIDHESITVCSITPPSNYNSVDGKPVHTMFIILSANSKRHLEILSKLVFLLQQPEFNGMLSTGAPQGDVMDYIIAAEKKMAERGK